MGRKVNGSVRLNGKAFLFFFLCFFSAVFFSCSKKYDYGNITSPDVLAFRTGFSEKEIPVLGEKVSVGASWLLDDEGIERVRIRVENYPGRFVELDLSACDVPSAQFGDSTVSSRAFEGLDNLGSVVLPYDMTTVPAGLFKDCVNLRSVTLPDRLTSIEGHAFEGCVNLKEIYTTGNPIYIFSYEGDGLFHPEIDKGLSDAKVFYESNAVDYVNWYQYCWEYSKRIEPKKISFAEIWASSFQSGYGPENLADGSWGTWFEGSDGAGEGQEIIMHFTRLNSVSTVTFRNGNGNTKNFWNTNRVKDMDVYFGNDPGAVRITLKDTCEKQSFRFLYGHRKMIQYDKIRFVIRSVYEGGKGAETCIAEISVNDEEMKDYTEDPYTRAMLDQVPVSSDELVKTEYRIWRRAGADPVMLLFNKKISGSDVTTDSLRCLAYDGNSWYSAQKQVWKPVCDVLDSVSKSRKITEFSFPEDDSDGSFDFKLQLKRPVEQYADALYGPPFFFKFDGNAFILSRDADFTMKTMTVGTADFFDEIEKLSPEGIYRIDLKGTLDRSFFDRMKNQLSAEKPLAINRNYILNMWDCRFAPEMHDALPADSISGYFIQLVLPGATKKISRAAVSVAADIISIPSGIEKIEPGAFVSSSGSLYDFYGNNVAFEGKGFSESYRLQGRLLLESIPDSGGKKRVLLYCGNAGEFLGLDDSSARSLVLPEPVTEIAPYAFYGSSLDSIVFPKGFQKACEKCFAMAGIKKVDLRAVNVERFSMETVRQFGLLLSSNPGVTSEGDFYCITASGKMTDSLIKKITEELARRSDKKVYLDLGGTTLPWNDDEGKFIRLPDMFLYNVQNLYWLTMGSYNFLPQNTCRDCSQLRCVQFVQEPELISEPSFKGCHAAAVAVVDGETYPLMDYARARR